MKLSPLTVPFRVLELLLGLGWLGAFLAFGTFTVVSTEIAMVATVLIIAGVVAASITYAVAYYRRFVYELTGDTFDVRYGVFAKRNREIPYHRIQNVSISKNVLHRLLGIAEVRVETAGGESAEVHLRFVSDDESRRLQEEITALKRDSTREDAPADPDAPTAPSVGERLFAIAPKELALLGVVSFDLRLLVVVFALFAFLDAEMFVDLFFAFPLFAIAPVAIVALYVVGAAISGIVAVTNYWDFELFELSDELRYQRGLLRQFSGSIPTKKIQSMTVTENVLARRFGYGKLLIETAGYSPGESSGSQTAVPLATRERVFALARSIEDFDSVSFERPPKRTRQRYFFRYTGVAAVIVAAAFLVDVLDVQSFRWYLTAGVWLLAPVAAHLKWVHLGYAVQEEYVITRAGFWNRRTHVVPYHRVQTVFQTQNVFQRRRDLASVRIDTAGTRALVGEDAVALDIDAGRASRLRELVHGRMQQQLSVQRGSFDWVTPDTGDLTGPGDPSA